MGSLVGFVDPQASGCQALLHVEVASCWLAGPVYEAADCGAPGGLGPSAVSLVGRVRVQKTLVLLLTHWWVKPGPWVSAS